MISACALGTNIFERERDTFFQTVRHHRRLELNLFNPEESQRRTYLLFFCKFKYIY